MMFPKMAIFSLAMAVYKRLSEMFVGCILAIYAMSLCFLHVHYGEFQQCENQKDMDNKKNSKVLWCWQLIDSGDGSKIVELCLMTRL